MIIYARLAYENTIKWALSVAHPLITHYTLRMPTRIPYIRTHTFSSAIRRIDDRETGETRRNQRKKKKTIQKPKNKSKNVCHIFDCKEQQKRCANDAEHRKTIECKQTIFSRKFFIVASFRCAARLDKFNQLIDDIVSSFFRCVKSL